MPLGTALTASKRQRLVKTGDLEVTAVYVRKGRVTLDDFTATLYHALGIDPAVRLSPDGFTRPASTGTPPAALF